MTDKITQLEQQVFATESPSRPLIVEYLKALASEAKTLPVAERDDLAYAILRPFIQLENPPDDAEFEYIIFQLAGGDLDTMQENVLDMDTDPERRSRRRHLKAEIWRELIECIEKLS